jgi:hypothetical protein
LNQRRQIDPPGTSRRPQRLVDTPVRGFFDCGRVIDDDGSKEAVRKVRVQVKDKVKAVLPASVSCRYKLEIWGKEVSCKS